MTDKVYFKPKEPDTHEFLRQIGLSETQISKGYVTTGENCGEGKIDISSLKELATTEPPPEGATEEQKKDFYGIKEEIGEDGFYRTATLSPKEAKKGLDLIKSHGLQKIQGLFRMSCSESDSILNNLLGKQVERGFFGAIIGADADCPYSNRFTPNEVLGIYYSPKLVPNSVADATKAVVEVTNFPESSGTAFFISSEGDLLTARHVLYDKESGKFREGSKIRAGDHLVPILKEQVISEDKRLDLARLQIRELKGQPYLKMGKRPTLGENVWAIGFPALLPIIGEEVKPLSTLGTIRTDETVDPYRVTTNARVKRGNSGGPLINERGEFVAVVHAVTVTTYTGPTNTFLRQEKYSNASIPPPDMLKGISK
ncbi:MAG: hypothetical protein A3F82_01065 [Deltaproteobacteria bacterium RIFCSPLOWO2_12_FULL_44_12]|nr:MAG: hypothetical protein A2712_03890 [Deltaproteobacteria bacterium RIFCSPHIGHO2_01_FULL_43_49]OGQ16328.1 MAG: hypothetical protein A3D22_01860 [Deltaproteobacteria bacterium RIFCSPHIGHO2_02_FULL_44_53]OGQ29288.1 MAG: hypothetical protein A3D98_05645 [Deltaproteobacteria bacterium RIFCSPHIGHO2_12_FULL_44_21]OGQ32845.1 MAG: hypothetical protein A2979_09790 [Deltaproteobacteria bacterium RIFCSPLOWO2_01_FULL_45_74]OGQ41946.1 MAG: hypothetical protein A3I70_09575 [Deltaproteobacteria bacterium 